MSREHIALILSSLICAIGLTENSTEIVIGCMAISPLISMLLATIKNKKILNFIGWLIVPIVVGFGVQILKIKFYDPYILHHAEQKDSTELLKRTGEFKNIIITSTIIGVTCGILLKLFPKDHVTLAGISIAISLLPPLVASGMFAGHYALTKENKHIKNSLSSFTLFAANVISLAIGYHAF
jgi:uncharacterized membrane protein